MGDAGRSPRYARQAVSRRSAAPAITTAMRPGAPPRSDGTQLLHFRAAGLLRRLAAAFVDGLLLLPLTLLFGGATAMAAGQGLPRLGELGVGYLVHLAVDGGAAGAVALGAGALVVAIYGVLFVGLGGRTPGLRALGLRVITAWGTPPSLARALLRFLGVALSLALFGLGLLWIGFSREKRGLHDLLAGTWVVHAEPQPAPRAASSSGRTTTRLGVQLP